MILETALSLEHEKRKENKTNRTKTPTPIPKNYSSINCLHLFLNYCLYGSKNYLHARNDIR